MLIDISASCDIAAIHALLYFIFFHNHFVSSAEHTNIHSEKNKTFNHGWFKAGSQSKMVDQHYSVVVGWYVRIQNAGWSWWHSEDCSRREVAMLSVELRKNDIPNMTWIIALSWGNPCDDRLSCQHNLAIHQPQFRLWHSDPYHLCWTPHKW